MLPLPGARLTLIDPNPTATYSGMLPGVIAGHYERADLESDLVRLARAAGARFIAAPATGIDPQARRVMLPGRPPVAYDVLSLDVGVTSGLPDLPGFKAHGIGAKPLQRYASAWGRFREKVRSGKAPPEIAVIGAGIGGAEIAMAMAHALRADGKDPVVTLLDRAGILPGVPPAT
ncbi:MAG: FAD-dependent oxidoreductase, partial [Actinomycetota bacterium]